ncbi:hypothetical protein CTI12_AA432690 [Artemisia annua]|uniref:Uncharacterized protein n=1 Tax=Artemisia annua TaxID=35608 RepID=A0A2U1M145_ARTAN|nr:hypothetical protein CTI12_AA432690 [Artemisia annua]
MINRHDLPWGAAGKNHDEEESAEKSHFWMGRFPKGSGTKVEFCDPRGGTGLWSAAQQSQLAIRHPFAQPRGESLQSGGGARGPSTRSRLPQNKRRSWFVSLQTETQ